MGVISAGRGNESLACAIALASYISEKWDKSPQIIYAGDTSELNQDLMNSADIRTGIEKQSLKITIDYSGTSIKSVDYDNREEESKLVLEVKPVNSDFNTDRIKFDVAGKDFDLIIAVGFVSLDDLQKVYSGDGSVVNFDNSSDNRNFGKINIVDTDSESLCALLLKKFGDWGYTPSRKVARILLMGF